MHRMDGIRRRAGSWLSEAEEILLDSYGFFLKESKRTITFGYRP